MSRNENVLQKNWGGQEKGRRERPIRWELVYLLASNVDFSPKAMLGLLKKNTHETNESIRESGLMETERSSRPFDVVVWGATGFTGRLVAEYIATRYGVGSNVRWALAGRNLNKLEKLRNELSSQTPNAANLPLLQAESNDLASLERMASQTRVVCTTVGPYSQHGSPLIAACISAKTDYCDITGEVHWARQMMSQYHAKATEQQQRMVSFCGMDSIPSDLGVYLLQREAQERWGQPLSDVHFYLMDHQSAWSGGTAASLLAAGQDIRRNPRLLRDLLDPYNLNPAQAPRGPTRWDPVHGRWDSRVQRWVAPFVMGLVNTRVVRRSQALLPSLYGQNFRYHEWMCFSPNLKGRLLAYSVPVATQSFLGLCTLPMADKVLSRFLPQPGEGPSQQQRESGFFQVLLVGEGVLPNGARKTLRVVCHGNRDPGYGATAGMLAESALCLALDQEDLPPRYGYLTTAAAMGDALLPRLRSAGVTFSVEKD